MPESTCDKCGEPDGGMFLFHGIVCGKTEAERAAISASLGEALRAASERRRRRHEASQ